MSVPQIKRRQQYYTVLQRKKKRTNEFNWGALSIVLHELLIICFSHTHPDKGTAIHATDTKICRGTVAMRQSAVNSATLTRETLIKLLTKMAKTQKKNKRNSLRRH